MLGRTEALRGGGDVFGVRASFLLCIVGEINLERKWQGGGHGVLGKAALSLP